MGYLDNKYKSRYLPIRPTGSSSTHAFTPADLAGLAVTVLPALSRVQGKLWMDMAKTVPAEEDGDRVRVATCPFTGVDFVAPSSGTRPTLIDEGDGKWSLDFDGIDDELIATLAGPINVSQYQYLFGTWSAEVTGSRDQVVFDADRGANGLTYHARTLVDPEVCFNGYDGTVRGIYPGNSGAPANVPAQYTGIFEVDQWTLKLNGASISSVAGAGVADASGAVTIYVGSYTDSRPLLGRIYGLGWAAGTVVSTDIQQSANDYFAALIPTWTPEQLTGLSGTMLPALSREMGLLWMDTGKTVPATEDGDRVRVATCPFTGIDFIAPSSQARPTLTDQGGGKWSLDFDGIDDQIYADVIWPSGVTSGSQASRFIAESGIIIIIAVGPAGNNIDFYSFAGQNYSHNFRTSRQDAFFATPLDADPHTYTQVAQQGANYFGYLDTVLAGTTLGSTSTPNRIVIGANTNSISSAYSHYGSIVDSDAWDDATRAKVESYIAALS